MADSIAVRPRPYRDSFRDAGSGHLTNARRPWAEAVLSSAALSLLFVFVYGECNALASRRTDLGTCFFAWELRIPFVPALIVPYMSIDLFFVASFLLCANGAELRTHVRRIGAAIIVAGLAFLLQRAEMLLVLSRHLRRHLARSSGRGLTWMVRRNGVLPLLRPIVVLSPQWFLLGASGATRSPARHPRSPAGTSL